jgi:MFS family permease
MPAQMSSRRRSKSPAAVLVTSSTTTTTTAATTAAVLPHSKPADTCGFHSGIVWGSVASFTFNFGLALTYPFFPTMKDEIQCNTTCWGGMQSARSAMGLVGSALIGRLSDRFGRTPLLVLGVVATVLSQTLAVTFYSIAGMWAALIPVALLNQNAGVSKALFADYAFDAQQSESDRASSLGKLGMAGGISFMLGPLIGSFVFPNYQSAVLASIVVAAFSGLLFWQLPEANRKTAATSWLELFSYVFLCTTPITPCAAADT